MGEAETATDSVEAVEVSQCAIEEPNATGIDGRYGMDRPQTATALGGIEVRSCAHSVPKSCFDKLRLASFMNLHQRLQTL